MVIYIPNKKYNPFKPGYPVDIKNFKGRQALIEEYANYLSQVSLGNMVNFLIISDRGMGKSSFAKYIKHIAITQYDLLSVHIYNDGIHDIDSLIRLIIEKLLETSKNKPWGKMIWDRFKNHIDSVSLFGVNIKFKNGYDNAKVVENIKSNFAAFLYDLTQNIGDKKGIFIIIDDVNGLSDTAEFSNWFKSFTETLTSFQGPTPISFMLLTTPDKLSKLEYQNQSFTRIFRTNQLFALNSGDVERFFINSFDEIGMSIDNNAIDLMVRFSSGQPTMMQEIGDAIFWTCKSDTISENDAWMGIFRACDEVGVKYLQLSLDDKIKNKKYLSIFEKIGKYIFNYYGGSFNVDLFMQLDLHEPYSFIKSMEMDFLKYDGQNNSKINQFISNLNDDERKILAHMIIQNSHFVDENEHYEFVKSDIEKELTSIEQNVFSDFLLKAKHAGVLDFSYLNEIGMYKFTNNLFPLYCMIKYVESNM